MDWLADFAGAIVTIVTTAIGAIFAGFVWLFNVDARSKGNRSELKRLELRMEEDRADARSSRSEQLETMRDMQKDIKRILEKMGSAA